MGQRFETRQSEKAAGALDGVNQAEDVIQNLGVVRILLEPYQLVIDGIQTLASLRQELPQQIVHQNAPSQQVCCGRPSTALRDRHPQRRSRACRRLLPESDCAADTTCREIVLVPSREKVQLMSFPATDSPSGFSFTLISVSVLIRMKRMRRAGVGAGPRGGSAHS